MTRVRLTTAAVLATLVVFSLTGCSNAAYDDFIPSDKHPGCFDRIHYDKSGGFDSQPYHVLGTYCEIP